jgi:hypothetical protein
MYFRELINMFLKYAIFGAVIFLVVNRVPKAAVSQRDDIAITLVSVAVFIFLEMFGGYFRYLKDFLCGCKSSSSLTSSTTCDSSSTVDDSLVL